MSPLQSEYWDLPRLHRKLSSVTAKEWSLWSTGHFCAEPDLAQETRPEARDKAEKVSF